MRRLIVVITLLVSACGQPGAAVDVGAAPTRASAPSVPANLDRSDATSPNPAPEPSEPPEMTSVTIYLTHGEELVAVTRRVPRVPRIGRAAIEQLLAGPTTQEAAEGHDTAVPAGTRLRDLAITDGVATVDLSGDFEEGGGTLSLTLRLAQVACTLDEFPTVDGVRFALDGTVVDVFSGDGLIIDEPVACSDYGQVVAS